MKPDQPDSSQSGAPLFTQGQEDHTAPTLDSQQAAAQIVRGQIDSLFEQQTPISVPGSTIENVNPYARTHEEHTTPQAEQWKQYHTAWQTYYQKYYEGYYTHHLQQALKPQTSTVAQSQTGIFSTQSPEQTTDTETLNKDEALFDLRQKLLGKVKASAAKVRKSRHFVPITAALIVILIFAFLQYNQLLIANVMAYVSPGNIDPQNIVIDPSTTVAVTPDPKLIIPKINVDVPVAYDIGNDYASQMAAMAKGVAWFGVPGASSHPGEIGNTVIAGHSSNDLLEQGDYKFIFAQLDKLEAGDTIYANYHSIRYTYVVTGKTVVSPTNVAALIYPTTKPVMTLLTCTPVGTAKNRLLVTAEQVSPDPSTSAPAPASSTSNSEATVIPGTEPTLLEKLFGGK